MPIMASDSPQDGADSFEFTIDMPRLAVILGIEVLGIVVMTWGLVEMIHWGNNPVSGRILIPLGSVVMTTGSVMFAKLYQGAGLIEMFTTKKSDD